MPQSDILKFIFHHDQRLEKLAATSANADVNPLDAFMKPDPTFSTFYFSGTSLDNEQFGINALVKHEGVMSALSEGFEGFSFFTKDGKVDSVVQAVESTDFDGVCIASRESTEISVLQNYSKQELRDAIENDFVVLQKLKAKDGFDLLMYSKENLYLNFFHPLKALLPDAFRLFSINGKRVISEKFAYFETWRLDKPPHGFEEVFPETVL